MSDPIRIVIVEDHEATLRGLEGELHAEPDIEVLGTARSCEEGLTLLSNSHAQLVLLDLHLPDSKGPKSLTQAFAATGSKIVVLSGDDRSAIIQLVLSLGVSGYVLKSEPLSVVVEAVRMVHGGQTQPVLYPANLLQESGPRITNAEQHLLRLLARGMKYNEIAAQRVTSSETVRKQIDALMAKLNLHTRERLIAWAVENGYGRLELE